MNHSTLKDGAPQSQRRAPFLTRVQIRNYKSIGKCAVSLGPLAVLVGRNGSGKSNFLDALCFVTDGLQASLDHAIKARGGLKEVRRRSTGHPRNFAIELEMELSPRETANYGFEIGSRPEGGFYVKREHLSVKNARAERIAGFDRLENEVKANQERMPPVTRDRLYLVTAAGLPEFRTTYDALVAMGFYNVNPTIMKEFQNPDAGELLHRNGGNIASVVGRLTSAEPDVMARISGYLGSIVPGITSVRRQSLGPKETLEFRQEVIGAEHPWTFYATSMSDGTLRAFGTLVAVTQLAAPHQPVRLVGIEEPETALHPAAVGALMDALREATAHTQVLVTTHSPDLIEHVDPDEDTLLAVQATRGDTEIGPVDKASRDAIRGHLYTAGELLRMDQLEVDRADLHNQQQRELFESV